MLLKIKRKWAWALHMMIKLPSVSGMSTEIKYKLRLSCWSLLLGMYDYKLGADTNYHHLRTTRPFLKRIRYLA